MKGLIVNYNGEETKVAVGDGMITVHVYNNNGESPTLVDGENCMYITGIDYEKYERYVDVIILR